MRRVVLCSVVQCGFLLAALTGIARQPSLAAAGDASGGLRPIEIGIDAPSHAGLDTWPLGVGVPFPRGQLRSGAAIQLRGQKQGPIPIQVTEKTRWPDGSVQWTWIDFQGNPRDKYVLDVRAPSNLSRTCQIKLTHDPSGVRVETGVMSVGWNKDHASPTVVRLGKSLQVDGDGQGFYVIDNRGRRGVLSGPKAELAWKVESAGPLRAVIRVEGWYVTAEGERLARAVIRYHLFAGQTFFTMDHTFIFTDDTDRLWFKEVAVRFPWQNTGSAQTRFGVKDAPGITAPLPEKGEAWIFQDDYPHFAQKRSHFSCGQQAGQAAAGWCEASDQASAITVAIQDMARQFPNELAIDRRGVTARLWSNRGGKELDYRPATLVDDYYGNDWIGAMRKGPVGGEMVPCDAEGFRKLNPSGLGSARTHFLLCAYHAQPPAANTSPTWAAAFDRPPVALADPGWLCTSGALWPVAPKDENRFPEAERFISEFFDLWLSRMDAFPMNGWIGRGVGPELTYEKRADGKIYASFYRLNNVAAYHTPKNVWVGFYRSGDRKFLDFAEPYTRFLADFATLHWGGGREKKQKGLIVTGMGPFPLYWAGSGYWETRGGSTDYLVPFRLAYFLRDCRWARDCLELYAEAANAHWDLEKCRVFNAPFTHLSMMLNAYLVTQDPRLEAKLHRLADALVDLNDPLAFSVAFYKRRLEYPYDATYKYERKVLALIDYYDTFGAEKAKKAVLKANAELFATASQCSPVAYQNYMPVHLAKAFEWTGNPDDRAVAATHLQAGLDWFREFKTLPLEKRGMGSFAPDKQGFAFFTLPHVLALMTGPHYVTQTFPYLANLGRDRECPICFLKGEGREASLLVSVVSALAEPVSISPRVIAPNGKDLPGSVHDEKMHHARVYRVTIPAAAPGGAYRASFGRNRFLVIGSNVDKLVLHVPEGTYFGHRDHLGYALTRNKPYYFQVPEGQSSITIRVSHPIHLFDPSGRDRDEARDKTGRITIARAEPGIWSFLAGPAAYVQLENVPPVVAFGEKSRFFLPPGIPRPDIASPWEPPKQEGLVVGRFGQGLHLVRKPYKAQWGRGQEFPFPEGTVEFFFRPDWTSRWLKEVGDTALCSAPPFHLTYRHQPQREGGNSFYTWLQFHPAAARSGFGWITRAEAYASFDAGQWYHLACTWKEETPYYAIYLDGAKVGELPDPHRYNRTRLQMPKRQGDGTITLGPWAGTYDEFRISKVVRYNADFTPPSQAFANDSGTAVLFHFDEDLRGEGKARQVEFARP